MSNEITVLVIQGDAFLQGKVEKILEHIINSGLEIRDYEFKHKFMEEEKEQMYLKNLNSGNNVWWFSKETFELGSCLALLVSTAQDDNQNIFEKTKSIKGKSNPSVSEENTIRSKFEGLCTAFNLLHCSDCVDEFERESSIFFSDARVEVATKSNFRVDMEQLFNELSLTTIDYSSRDSCINSFLCKIYHYLARFSRNNGYDLYDQTTIAKIVKENNYKVTREELKKLCNDLLNCLDVKIDTIDVISLCIYTLEILSDSEKNFILEKFMKVIELNMIKIPDELRVIITGILKYESNL